MAKAKSKKRGMAWQKQVLMIFILLAAIAAMSTTIILFFGLLPTLVALFIDRTRDKTRALSVGAMNLAGCTPFVLQLWTTDNSFSYALNIIIQPETIIVIYCAAGVGYLLDWAISGLIGGVMVQRATGRRTSIAKRQEDLVARWGQEVTGEIAVDAQGFPILREDITAESEKQKTK